VVSRTRAGASLRPGWVSEAQLWLIEGKESLAVLAIRRLNAALRQVEGWPPPLAWPGLLSRKRAWKTGFKVQDRNPARPDRDSSHVRKRIPDLLNPSPSLLLSEVPRRRRLILRCGSPFNSLDMRCAANLQDPIGPSVTIDRDGHSRTPGERLQLRRLQRRTHYDLFPGPVEPDWHDSRSVIQPAITQLGWHPGLQQFLSNRILQQAHVTLLGCQGSFLP